MMPSAKVIADSTYGDGSSRVTTVEAVMHRFVLAEFNTHRAFSRNSASSRAIPVAKQLDRVRTDPAVPLSFPAEQRGMQGGDELPGHLAADAYQLWTEAAFSAATFAEGLADIGVHKSVTNRLLEPFMWHTVIVTSVEWDNFFAQRCSPLAQPEIRATAEAIRNAIGGSAPEVIEPGWDWHLPYVDAEERHGYPLDVQRRVSTARCARVSYLTQDGRRDIEADLALYDRLVNPGDGPPHWSPLEHPCTPDPDGTAPGNLPGWRQLRHTVSGEWIPA